MRRLALPLVVLALVVAGATPLARAATASIVISQVYAGGGNAGASYQNDFVELVNRGTTAVDLSGWTLQYAPATGTSWQSTPLTGTVAAGRYYLVQLASSASIGAPLPTPEAMGTTNLSATGGKVALVHGTAALTCGATVGSCSAVATVDDLVGYGTATDYEGAGAAPGLDSTTSAIRAAGGCADTGSSAADFTAVAPVPRTTATPALSCGGTSSAPGGTQSASVDIDVAAAIGISLERSAISFGSAVAGTTPAPLSERVSVTSNYTAGYALSVHRSQFAPADLPLGIGAAAPAGAQLGAGIGGTLAAVPVAPASDLLIGTTAAASPAAGDSWPLSVGFAAPLPAVAPGHYTATVTFTVVGR
jgi:hypothetical protein